MQFHFDNFFYRKMVQNFFSKLWNVGGISLVPVIVSSILWLNPETLGLQKYFQMVVTLVQFGFILLTIPQ